MQFIQIEEVDSLNIKQFQESFHHSKDVIHGANQLQQSNNIEKWLREVVILKSKDYKQHVQTSHYALLDNQGTMVGISDVKHHLNSYLQKEGGHISYSISPPFQNLGYGHLILNATLIEAKRIGLRKVLLTCRQTNDASKRLIKKNGGVYIRTMSVNRYLVDHYVIELEDDNNVT